jgi:hypothetical protein
LCASSWRIIVAAVSLAKSSRAGSLRLAMATKTEIGGTAMKWVAFLYCLSQGCTLAAASSERWVGDEPKRESFPLVFAEKTADVVYAVEDFRVVSIAVNDLARDVERVTGKRPTVQTNATTAKSAAVLVGTLGRSPLIDEVVRKTGLDVSALRDQWESFLIATVTNPLSHVSRGLVIVGSDRRGTAYGVYELSQAIGVSPWYWWADVAPERKAALFVQAGTRRFGPPSVRYRGIFINDEDWGLQPWAAETFELEVSDLGPRTYSKVFELLLRLKANTLWPAMHACTKPFNHYPQNRQIADDYAIVMGSSHAEPMLRNNVGEWTDAPEKFNYVSNREGVLKYWERRVAENGRFESIYTLGMRGIHDSAMQGTRTSEERVKLLKQIFTDQRAVLTNYVGSDIQRIPQVFCAYKEVLDLYRSGLEVPDDVTIVWPDDNFGYVRNFASKPERLRQGGFGVYYHISYLGRPLSYLWLYTTPPALIWEEMNRAYDHGANRVWIVNVGDIKPAEIGMEFFLQMAWDIGRWRRDNVSEYLGRWAEREFGAANAKEAAEIMDQYFRLNYQRKPEHLQWWLPNQPPRPSPLTEEEIGQRLATFADLRTRVDALKDSLRSDQHDAFSELVAYPVKGAALANERYFFGERAARTAAEGGEAGVREWSERADAAHKLMKDETRGFGETIAAGKWRGFMRLEPADNQWQGMRISPWSVPQFEKTKREVMSASPDRRLSANPPPDFRGFVETRGVIAMEAESFAQRTGRRGAQWEVIPGLGRTGGSVAIFPTTTSSVAVSNAVNEAPHLDYAVCFLSTGEFPVHLYLIPTHPSQGSHLRLALSLDEEQPRQVSLEVRDGGVEWAQGVLSATRVASTKLEVTSAGVKTLHVYGTDAGVVLDKIVIDCGGLKPDYLGPAETRWSPKR